VRGYFEAGKAFRNGKGGGFLATVGISKGEGDFKVMRGIL